MAVTSRADLKTRAQIIRAETGFKANTAERVGSFIEDAVDSIILELNEVASPAANTSAPWNMKTILGASATASTVTIASLAGIPLQNYGVIENNTGQTLTINLSDGTARKTRTLILPDAESLHFTKTGANEVSVVGDGPALLSLSQLSNDLNFQTDTDVQALIDTAVQNLIDSSPAALDTLNELAAALGDDANFSTTITNLINTVQTNLTTHINDSTNPHAVTFTQAVAADGGTDITPAEAEELTNGSTTELHKHTRYNWVSGKFDLWLNNNWSTWSDPTHGPNLHEMDSTSGGNGATPNIDWDGQGMAFPVGAVLKKITVKCRANNNDVDTVEIYARVHDTDWTVDVDIDNNAEVGATELFTPQTFDLDAGAKNADGMGFFEQSLNDYTFTNFGDLHLFVRATSGTLTANRQLRCTMIVEWEM